MTDGNAADAQLTPGPLAPEPKSSKGPDPLIGRVINDRFRIISHIARGGMGKVYRAEQAPLGREIALKVLNPNYSGDTDPEFHKRFFLEASTCSKLTHPNTVTIFDYGRTDDDVYYIAMELLEGRTLHRLLRDEGALEPARAMHITRQICRSLREAHTLGVIHRDLKPANVFLVQHGDENDFVKVLDFGLVKDLEETGEDLTQTGLFMGSPKYMSPEQIRGEGVDARADIYALGIMLYQMLAGKVPFDRPNSVNTLMAHVHEAPPPIRELNPDAEITPELEALVLRTLAKSADDRFASMDTLLVGLKEIEGDGGTVTGSSNLGMSVTTGLTGHYDAVSGTPPGMPGISGQTVVDLDGVPGLEMIAVEPERRSKLPIIIAVMGSLALLGAVAVVLVVRGGEPPPVAPEPVVEAPDEPVVEPPPPEPAEPAPPEPVILTTMVELRSTPAGATVLVEGAEIGQTPSDVEWRGADAERGRRVTFLIQLEGHRDYSVTRVVTGERLAIDATLEPIVAAPRPGARRRTRRGATGTGGGNVGPVKGYKLDPY